MEKIDVKTLREYVRLTVSEGRVPPGKRLRIFDFDDTIARTGSFVRVTSKSGGTFKLTPGEYAVYQASPGDVFDYSDFDRLVDPREVKWTMRILRNVVAKGGEVVILTARAKEEPVRQFIADAGLPPLQVVALGDANPARKAEYVERRILKDGIQFVEFFDDSYKNVDAVARLGKTYPNVKILARLVTHAAVVS